MRSNVTLLNVDGGYKRQSFYTRSPYNWINLESFQGTNLMCEKETTLKAISKQLPNSSANNMTFLGNGNYHYLSYALQSTIYEPYSLILFDHHSDAHESPSDSLITCGSWVYESLLNLPMLEKVVMIGVSNDAWQHIPAVIRDRVVIYTENDIKVNSPLVMMAAIIRQIPTKSIYLSIDKDVLSNEDTETNWDHGTMRLAQMLGMLKSLFKNRRIIGEDVCGEYPLTPDNEHQQKTKQILRKNNWVNQMIVSYSEKWKAYQTPQVSLHA